MSGLLRRRVSLWAPARLADGGGGGRILYTEQAVVWAAVTRLAAVRDVGGDSGRFLRRTATTIRGRADVALGWRVRADGVFYEIVSIEPADAREKRLTLVGEEILP